MKKLFALILVVALLAITATTAFAGNGTGFDQYGYNDNGNVFNGTVSGWCLAGGQSADCGGAYSNDKLIMKWNSAWDACNAAGYNDPTVCAGAWTSNEYNGAFPGGSGEVWHYKMIWVGAQQWDVSGLYPMNTHFLGMDFDYTLTLSQSGNMVTGNLYDSYLPGDLTIFDGTVNGNILTFSVNYGTGSVQGIRTFTGTISASGLSGTWSETGTEAGADTWSTSSGAVLTEGPYWRNGGYRIWNNYEVIMDQGMSAGAHTWLAHASPNGYGN